MLLVAAFSDGETFYHSKRLREGEVKAMLASAAAVGKAEGLFTLGGKRMLAKGLMLDGRRLMLYIDAAEDTGIAETLLDYAFLERGKAARISLALLARLFRETFASFHQISLAFDEKWREAVVTAPPEALVFCLSLMARALSADGQSVRISVVQTEFGVTFFADSAGRVKRDCLFCAMLAEAASVQGFKVELYGEGTVALMPTVADAGFFGFKNAEEEYIRRICKGCFELFFANGDCYEENC